MEKIVIAFLTAYNVNDRNVKSGTPFYLSKLLNIYCGEVHCIHNFRPQHVNLEYLITHPLGMLTWLYLVENVKNLLWSILGKRFQWDRSASVAKYYARIVQRKLCEAPFDVIFADKASIEVAFLKTNIPIIYSTDAVFGGMIDYYPGYFNLTPSALKAGNALEKKALMNAKVFICASQWAADSAQKCYGVEADKIRILPRPPLLESPPEREVVLKRNSQNTCELLFVGVDWKRKGGDVAVATVEALNEMGVEANLTVCGCLPPEKYRDHKHLVVIGFLDKNQEKDRKKWAELFLKANFFILPTRAECMGIVFSEASAYGLPILATRTGGVPSAVYDGENGILLALDATGADYAKVIDGLWCNREKYERLRFKSREIYEKKLSPEVWGKTVAWILEDAVLK